MLETLLRDGHIARLLHAGARLHQAGCNGCIGMGQAPASGRNSLRTVPRNFPGRSGTREDSVFLCSPETAAASALTGLITDPRTLDIPYPRVPPPDEPVLNSTMLVPPVPEKERHRARLERGPGIVSLPELEPIPDEIDLSILLKMGDDVSTDEILPGGTRGMAYWSKVEKMSEVAFDGIDPTYPQRAAAVRDLGGHAVVGGRNYGQGSSRDQAALAPRYLGLRLVLAKRFARIHWENLVNFRVLPLTFVDDGAYDAVEVDDVLVLESIHDGLRTGAELTVRNRTKGAPFQVRHDLSRRQLELLLEGGVIHWNRRRARNSPAR